MACSLRASTVNAMQQAVLTVIRQHAPTMRAAEDLRLLLDEVIGQASVADPEATMTVSLTSTPDGMHGTVEVQPVDTMPRADRFDGLVDMVTVRRADDALVVDFSSAWT